MVIILEIYFYNLLTIMSLISVCFYKRKLIEAYPLCLDDTARIPRPHHTHFRPNLKNSSIDIQNFFPLEICTFSKYRTPTGCVS